MTENTRITNQTVKGQSRAYRKALRKIGLRNFPLSGAFHVRTTNGGILLPHEVKDYSGKGLEIRNGAKPFWRPKSRVLAWTNGESGCYSAQDGLSIERCNTKHFILSRDGVKLFKGRLKECQAEAQKIVNGECVTESVAV